MRLLVAGGRDRYLNEKGYQYLNRLHEQYNFTELVNGMASGIDRCAREWANSHNIPVKPFPALWDKLDHSDVLIKVNKYGKKYDARAGIRRNMAMCLYLSIDDIVCIFKGGNGSKNMRDISIERGLHVIDLIDNLSYVQ